MGKLAQFIKATVLKGATIDDEMMHDLPVSPALPCHCGWRCPTHIAVRAIGMSQIVSVAFECPSCGEVIGTLEPLNLRAQS